MSRLTNQTLEGFVWRYITHHYYRYHLRFHWYQSLLLASDRNRSGYMVPKHVKETFDKLNYPVR